MDSLSLDSQRVQHHQHLHHLTQQSLNSRYVEKDKQNIEEEEDLVQSSPKSEAAALRQSFEAQPFTYFNISQQQELHQNLQLQQQQFYSRIAQYHQQLPPLSKKRSHVTSTPSSTIAKQDLKNSLQPNMKEQKKTSRQGMRSSGGGEIIEVEGGHIVRATGRKDRHSKVCTAKGPRDRRVRLSAHTAIQFYDVQDRLGYDRPSKAVDWLIKKAKSAIDELAQLPPWHPTSTTMITTATTMKTNASSQQDHMVHEDANNYTIQHQQHEQAGNENNSSFLPPSMDSDSIANTIKTFFPMGASAERTSGSGMHFYPPDVLSRTSSSSQNNQDLRLSLQSFQDSQFVQTHLDHHYQQNPDQSHQAIFSRHQLGLDASSGGVIWSDRQPADINRLQRLVAWNNAAGDTAGGGESEGSGFMFNSLPPPMSQPALQQFFGQSGQYFPQGGPLQSSYSGNASSVRAWIDLPINNHNQHHPLHEQSSTLSGTGSFQTQAAFSGFRIPARIRGEYEEQDGINNNPSPASSDSHH